MTFNKYKKICNQAKNEHKNQIEQQTKSMNSVYIFHFINVYIK